jgi:hypothetical protein
MNGSKTVNPSAYPHLKTLPRLGQMAWLVVRIPILAFLVVLEPVVSFVLAGCALLGILTTFFFKWTSADPRFPFWTMLGISIGFAIVLILYDGLIHLLSRR